MRERAWLPVKFPTTAVLNGHRLGRQVKHDTRVPPYVQVWYLIQLKVTYFHI